MRNSTCPFGPLCQLCKGMNVKPKCRDRMNLMNSSDKATTRNAFSAFSTLLDIALTLVGVKHEA